MITSRRVSARLARPSASKRNLAAAVAHVAVGVLALSGVQQQQAKAANYYWDIDGATAGAGSATPSGTWTSTSTNWTTDANGAIAGVTFLNDGTTTPTFSAGTNATGSFTVTISGQTGQFNGLLTEEGTVTIAGASGGAVNLTGLTMTVNTATTTISAPVSSSIAGTFTKAGAGALTLNNVNNTFNNDISITAGALTITNGQGAAGTGTTAIQVGANSTLNLNTVGAFSRPVTLATSGNTVLNNSGGTNTFTGIITAQNTSTAVNQTGIGSSSGTLFLTVADQIQAAGGGTFNGSLTKSGGGTLSINAAQTKFSGPVFAAGLLQFQGAGAMTGMTSLTFTASGGALIIDNGTTQVADRIADTTGITVVGDNIAWVPATTAVASSETVGTLTVKGQGASTANFTNNFITMNNNTGGGASTFTLGSISRESASLLIVRGPQLGTSAAAVKVADGATNLLRGGNGTTATNKSILSGVLGDASTSGTGTDFVTYNATNGITPLVAADYATSITSGSTNKDNVSLTAASTVASSTNINSLKLGTGSSVTVNAGSTLTLSSGMILNTAASSINGGTLAVPGDTELVLANRADLSIGSNITGSTGLSKVGTANLTLGGNSTYAGPTYLIAANTTITSNNALGDSSGQTFVTRGASLQLSNNITTPESVTINGFATQVVRGTAVAAGAVDSISIPTAYVGGLHAASGSNTITGNVYLAGTGANIADAAVNAISASPGATVTIAGVIQNDPAATGSRTPAFTGEGTIVLSNANTYTGLTRMWGGTVIVESNQAFGLPAAGSIVGGNNVFQLANTTSTIAFRAPASSPAGFTYNAAGQGLNIAGFGAGLHGTLENISGNNTYTGQITIGQTASNGQINYKVYQPTYLNVIADSLTLSGSVQSADRRYLVKTGTGNLILAGSNGVGGIFEVNQGTLTFGSADGGGSGGLLSPNNPTYSAINVLRDGTLTFDNSTYVYAPSDYGGGSPLTNDPVNLYNGEFKAIGNTGGWNVGHDFTQTAFNGVLNAFGTSTLTVVPQGYSTSITAPARTNRNTWLARGMGGGVGKIMLTSDGSGLVGGILPYAVGDASATGTGTDFVTYDAGVGSFRVLTAGEYGALTSGTSSAVNASATGSNAITANTSVNALKLSGASAGVTINGGATLNVQSGAVLSTGTGASISGGTLDFGGAEGIVSATAGTTLAVNSVVSGSNGLTISGNGTVTLGGSNTFTGGLQLNGGTLVASSDANLGAAAGGVTLAGGTFAPTSGISDITRGVAIVGRPQVSLGTGQTMTVSGLLSGSGQLNKVGAGNLVLTGNNTGWTGGFNILGGTLTVTSAGALGPAASIAAGTDDHAIRIDGGTMAFAGTGTMDLGAGHPIWFGRNDGTIDVASGLTVKWDTSASATPMTGPGAFIKTGGGVFEFVGDSPNHNGGTYINGGTIRSNWHDTFPGSTKNSFIVINNGGRLEWMGNNGSSKNITNIDVIMNDGSTMAGQNGANYVGGGGGTTNYNPQVAAGATVTIESMTAGQTFGLGGMFVNKDGVSSPVPTIRFKGPGTLNFNPGTISTTFRGNYVLTGGVTAQLLADNVNVLGSNASGALNTVTFDTTGTETNTLVMRNGANRAYNYPVTVKGSATFVPQSTTAGGSAGFTDTFGTLSVSGDQTIALAPQNGTNGITSGTASVVFGATSLTGSPTFSVANPTAGGTGNITLGALSQSAGTRDITKSGAGNLTLGGAGSIGGALNIGAGGVIVTSTPTVGRINQTAGSALTINGASAKLSIAANGTTASLLTAIPTFTGTAPELDITNNKVVVDYTGATIASDLRTALANGAKFVGNVPGWNGNGIVSFTAKNNTDKTTGIGYLEASDYLGVSGGSYGNLTVDGSALLLKYTYFGDINLDGKVNGDDFALLDRGFARYSAGIIAASTATWVNGDVNYDGAVDSNDYLLADTAFLKQTSTLSPEFLAGREAQFGSEYVSQLIAAVPEPTSLGIIGLAGFGLLGSRRRRGR